MADQLGEAVLKIRVDDGDALRKLGELKTELSEFEARTTRSRQAAAAPIKPKSGLTEFLRELRTREQAETAADRRIARRREEAAARLRSEAVRGSVRVVGSPRFTARGARQGGPREDVRALEIAQERRFRIARRIDLLEENGVNVSRLRNRLGVLTDAQSRRQFGTFRQISQELRRQVTLEERRLATQRRQQREASRGARQGGASESITALFDAQRRRYSLDQQIRSLEAAGVNTEKLRTRLGEVTEAQGKRRFGTAKKLGQELNFQLQKERDILSTRQRQERAQTRQARAAEAETRRIARLNASPVLGGVAFPGSPNAIRARDAEARRVARLNTLPVLGLASIPDSPAGIRAAELRRKNEERRAREAERRRQSQEQRQLAEGRRIGRLNASPVRGGAAFPGSPAFLDAQFPAFPAEFFRKQKQDQTKQQRIIEQGIKRRNDILSNALIGGAFPALFGQGLGASIGGAAGGAAGGAIGGQFGFGLSLLGTAVGAQVDVAIQKFRDLAKALDDPIKNFDLLVQNASLSSKEVEKYAQALINSGRSAEAAAVIQSDLIDTFGSAQGAKEYNNAIDTLSRSWSQATTVLAGFVAGPLAALIRQLQQPTGGAAIGLSFEQLAGQLSPEQYRQVQTRREQATEASRLSRGGLSALLPPSNEDVNAGLKAGIALAQELLGIERQRAEIAARIAAAQVLNTKALSTSYELINASVQGYTLQALQKQREVALNERNIALFQLTPEQRLGPEGQKIQQDTALKVYELDVQINDLRKERVALATEEAAKYQLAAEKVSQELKAVQSLAALSQNAQRTAQFAVQQSTLQTIEGIQTAVGDARRREREIGAQIDAARLRGGDAGEQEAARLVNEQKLAAQQTRLELEKGSDALVKAGIKLREDVNAAFLNLQKLRTGPEGLNAYLGAGDRARREQEVFKNLLPGFRQDQQRFKELTGARIAPEFSGPTQAVNASIIQFRERVQAEEAALDTAIDTQKALNENTSRLAEVNADLAAKVAELSAKDWTVQLTQDGSGHWNASGDARSQAELRAASTLP